MSDLFNGFSNSANNYVIPALSPCAGNNDDEQIFQFLDKDKVGITNGSEILGSIDFSDFSVEVAGWNKEIKYMQSGEIIYIPGLTKGLSYRQQAFILPILTGDDLNSYFMQIDLSINYYKNFRYYESSFCASSNYDLNIPIDSALNTMFSDAGVSVVSTYADTSILFNGSISGYDFNITNVVLTLIDASENGTSPFQYDTVYNLTEDTSVSILYAKYLNGAMQGLVVKVLYPTTVTNECDKWIYIKHVPNTVNVYEDASVQNENIISTNITYYFDASTNIGRTKPSVSLSVPDASNGTITNFTINSSTLYNFLVSDSSVTYSELQHCNSSDNFILKTIVSDSSVQNCIFTDCSISNSLVTNNSSINSGVIINTLINAYVLLVNPSTLERIVVYDGAANIDTSLWRCSIYETEIWDSSINNSIISDSSIFRTYLTDCSLINCTVYNSEIESCTDISTRIINIDASVIIDVSTSIDGSTYYIKKIKTIDVGMNGDGTDEVMSAGDYLDYVNTNSLWVKVGGLYMKCNAPDSEDDESLANLINGFYIYNCQDYPVKVEYMVIV